MKAKFWIVGLAALVALALASTAGAGTTTAPTLISSYSSAQLEAGAYAAGQPTTSVTTVASINTAAGITCWNNTQEGYHGTWPQQHNEIMFTHWCGTGNGGTITQHQTSINADTFFCSFDSSGSHTIGGGNGSTSVSVQGDAYFSCPTGIPWVNLHFHEWMQIKYGPGGYVAILNQS